MIIKFSSTTIKKCKEFAETIDTSFYATRGQSNNEKRIKDQLVGKLGEMATYQYFKDKEIELSKPDLKIYDKSKKSWDYDLKNEDINLHVKTQNIEQGKRYGTSWLFEKNDRHFMTDVKDNDYICFVTVDLEENQAEIKSILKVKTIHKLGLFKKPKLDYLVTKVAIYHADISKLKFSL